MAQLIAIDDQPISATFFDEGKFLTEFITPGNLEVQELHKDIVRGLSGIESKLTALHGWVGSNIRYTRFVRAKMWVANTELIGKSSTQNDCWVPPSLTRRIGIGNCATKSFLLASLVRNELPENSIYCVLGNLYNGKPGGHAWVQVRLDGREYIMESTRPDVPALIPVSEATKRYEAVHLFNDKETYAIEGRTVLEPFTACFSTWLKDYLDWSYIEGRK